MKRDNLEQFVRDNREGFDDAVPNLRVWADIDRQLRTQPAARPRLRWLRALSVAASIAVLLTLGAGFGFYIAQSPAQEEVSLASVDPQYAEMEQFFTNTINDRMARLANYEQKEAVLQDLEQVDEVMRELQEELRNAPKGSEETIVENLIRTYQAKIAILERVLDRMETVQPNTKTNNDEISI